MAITVSSLLLLQYLIMLWLDLATHTLATIAWKSDRDLHKLTFCLTTLLPYKYYVCVQSLMYHITLSPNAVVWLTDVLLFLVFVFWQQSYVARGIHQSLDTHSIPIESYNM